jgi:hypothetical protein
MQFHVSKAVPVIERRRWVVVGWICTVHAVFEGGSGFDDLKFMLPADQHRPLSDWTAASLRVLLDQHCPTHPGFRTFVERMAFRRDYAIQDDFSLTQLGAPTHVYLTCTELSQ